MGEFPSTRRRRARGLLAAACGAAAIAITAAACGSSGTSSAGGAAVRRRRRAARPSRRARRPTRCRRARCRTTSSRSTSSTYFSVVNSAVLPVPDVPAALLVRQRRVPDAQHQPQRWPTAPVYNGNNVTITMKGWKWSNGETVTAQNVVFWIHMLQAVGATDWGAFVPGGFPTNVTNVKATNATTLTMTMNKAYNPTWFTSNELSQITPMPEAWDRTASGPEPLHHHGVRLRRRLQLPGQPVQEPVGLGVLAALVDRRRPVEADGLQLRRQLHVRAEHAPTRGPVKPTAGASSRRCRSPPRSAEYNVLQASSHERQQQPRSTSATCRPPTRRPSRPTRPSAPTRSAATPCPAVLVGDQLLPAQLPVHHRQRPDPQAAVLPPGAAVRDEPGGGDRGAAARGTACRRSARSGATRRPRSSRRRASRAIRSRTTRPRRSTLLTSHGWTVVPNGTTTCTDPDRVRPGHQAGPALSFTLPYATGTNWIEQEMTQLQSNACQIGIKLNLEPKPFDQVTAHRRGQLRGREHLLQLGHGQLGRRLDVRRRTTTRRARRCSCPDPAPTPAVTPTPRTTR